MGDSAPGGVYKKFRILERVECKRPHVSRKFTFDTSTKYVCVQLYGIYVSISLGCRNILMHGETHMRQLNGL